MQIMALLCFFLLYSSTLARRIRWDEPMDGEGMRLKVEVCQYRCSCVFLFFFFSPFSLKREEGVNNHLYGLGLGLGLGWGLGWV